MFGLTKLVSVELLASIVYASNHTICVSLKNQQFMIQPTLNNLYPNEYGQGLRYYQFADNLDRCIESCNTLNILSNKLCVPDKTEDLNLNVFNMITGIKSVNKTYIMQVRIQVWL